MSSTSVSGVLRLEEYVWVSAERYPNSIALELPTLNGGKCLTYRELHTEVLQLSWGICQVLNQDQTQKYEAQKYEVQDTEINQLNDVGSQEATDQFVHEPIIIITLPRNQIDAYLCLLATLEFGAAYCVIDAQFPPARAQQILTDAQPLLVICEESQYDQWKALTQHLNTSNASNTSNSPLVCTPSTLRELTHKQFKTSTHLSSDQCTSFLSPTFQKSHEALAYLIYTSGSTGTPKGVMIEHQNISHLIADDLQVFDLGPQDRLLQGSSHAYDSSVEEMFMAWSAGATVVIGDDQVMRLGPDLVPWLRDHKITIIAPPPTLLRTLGGREVARSLPDLRLIYVGGEALTRDVAEIWAEGRLLVNGYGPTECSVTATRAWIAPDEDDITIGKPHPGLKALIVDELLQPVIQGERGELLLSGPALARGYLNHPKLTAERFPTHPEFGRVYRTGDLASFNEQGLIRFHGRIDRQVKLRGYRLELSEVESHILEVKELREVACVVVNRGVGQQLVALYVSDSSVNHDELLTELLTRLPHYMVPSVFIPLERLPRLTSDKIDRKALEKIATESAHTSSNISSNTLSNTLSIDTVHNQEDDQSDQTSENSINSLILLLSNHQLSVEESSRLLSNLIAKLLDVTPSQLHPDQDFFMSGGDSISAAMLISYLRRCPPLSNLAVRDIYEVRSPKALVELALSRGLSRGSDQALNQDQPMPLAVSWLTLRMITLIQGLIIMGGLLSGVGITSYLFLVTLSLISELSVNQLTYLAMILWLFLPIFWVFRLFISLPLVKLAKWILIGKYRPRVDPVWGWFYLRHWLMGGIAKLIPWHQLESSPLKVWVLRQLGAQIGSHVYLHRGVNFSNGGWDLIEIGDQVTIGRDVSIRTFEFERLTMRFDRVIIESGATLETRSGVAPGGVVGAGSILSPHSVARPYVPIPSSTFWHGSLGENQSSVDQLAWSKEMRDAPLDGIELSPKSYLLRFHWAQFITHLLIGLPFILGLGLWEVMNGDTQILSHDGSWFGEWIQAFIIIAIFVIISWVSSLIYWGLLCRWRGRVPLGVYPVYSTAMIHFQQKERLLMMASQQLSGTLFWPSWLRLAGMKVGSDSEISTIMECVPEHLTLEGSCFSADGIYLGAPRLDQGRIHFKLTHFEPQIFLGNHAVIPAGTRLASGTLLGICTVADQPTHPQSSWFGNPSFELPRREVVEVDETLTHRPSKLRYMNRWLWEFGRVGIPIILALELVFWFSLITKVSSSASWIDAFTQPSQTAVLLMSSWTLGLLFFNVLIVWIMKWGLLGRMREGQHPLWSCWCSRWDSIYVYWGALARPVLSLFEGTLWLNMILRFFGLNIGKRVFLGSGFAQVVDPDMLHFADQVTVMNLFQAHSFEDRVLKLAPVHFKRGSSIGAGTVVLYGAQVGEETVVLDHSVLMKRETLAEKTCYAGMPSRVIKQR